MLCVHHIYAIKYCVTKIKGVPITLGKKQDGEVFSSHGSFSGLKIVFCTAELYSVVINSFSVYGYSSLVIKGDH